MEKISPEEIEFINRFLMAYRSPLRIVLMNEQFKKGTNVIIENFINNIQEGRFDEAVAIFDDNVETNPNNVIAKILTLSYVPGGLKDVERYFNEKFGKLPSNINEHLKNRLLDLKKMVYQNQASIDMSLIWVKQKEIEPAYDLERIVCEKTTVDELATEIIKITEKALKISPKEQNISNDIKILEDRISAARILKKEDLINDTKEKIAAIDPNNHLIKNSSSCFIATAVYESPFAPEVMWLREWRDQFLLKHLLGRASVKVYYIVGPYLAYWISKSELKKRVIRKLLDRLIGLLKRK